MSEEPVFTRDWPEDSDEIASAYTLESAEVDLVKLYAIPLPALLAPEARSSD